MGMAMRTIESLYTGGQQHNEPSEQSTVQVWLVAGAVWFVAIALIGTAMRAVFALGVQLPLPFQHVLHAHSHLAFFGWMGSVLTGVYYAILPRLAGVAPVRHRGTLVHFWLLQLCSVGACIAFLAQGYKAVSIAFSTFHLFLWYYFAWRLRAQFRSPRVATSPVLLLMNVSVGMLVVSSLGTWSLPYVVLNAHGTEFLKQMSVDFFVHTFADGWLLLGVFALVLLSAGTVLPAHRMRQFRLNVALSIPAIVLSSVRSVAPEFPLPVQVLILGAGVLLGLLHLHALWLCREAWKHAPYRLFAAFLVVKAIMEIVPVVPGGMELLANRFLLIAYLHTKLLGIASTGVVLALHRLFPAPQQRSYALPLLFGYGSAAMVCCLLLTGAPALAQWIGVEHDVAVLVPIGHSGALIASLVLLGAGVALCVSRWKALHHRTQHAPRRTVQQHNIQHAILCSNQKG